MVTAATATSDGLPAAPNDAASGGVYSSYLILFLVVSCAATALYYWCKWRKKHYDPLLPNEVVGDLEGHTRDSLEGSDVEATKWTCGICDFHNPAERASCLLCATAQGVFLLHSPAFDTDDGTALHPDQLNAAQTSARLRKQWRRQQHHTTGAWGLVADIATALPHFIVGTFPPDEFQLAPLTDASAAMDILGHSLPAWWSAPLDQLQREPFALKYAWLVHHMNETYAGHVKFTVSRVNILKESLQVLSHLPVNQLCSFTRVVLKGEVALDAGGIAREWYTLLSTAILEHDQGLFIVSNKEDQSFFINPNSEKDHGPNHLESFRAIGRLIGKAIIDEQVLPFHFCVPLFKMLLGYPVSMEDVRYLDPTVYSSLVYVRDCDDVDDLALTFSVSVDEAGSEVELVAGGRDIGVTNATKAEYVDRMVQYLLFDRVAPQLQRLVQGLYDVLPQELLMPFDYKEVELILCGFSEIDVADWKRSTIVSASLADVVGWFWDVVEFDMTASDRAKLLQFTTGSSRVPLQGFKGLTSSDGHLCQVSLHGVPYEPGAFPQVHSCFNRIDLPIYPTREELRHVLFYLVAIENLVFTLL